jgi:hypothetical protein
MEVKRKRVPNYDRIISAIDSLGEDAIAQTSIGARMSITVIQHLRARQYPRLSHKFQLRFCKFFRHSQNYFFPFEDEISQPTETANIAEESNHDRV